MRSIAQLVIHVLNRHVVNLTMLEPSPASLLILPLLHLLILQTLQQSFPFNITMAKASLG